MKTLNRLQILLVSITVICALLLYHVSSPKAQSPERWEQFGPVTFTSIASQSPTTLVMTMTRGFLYVSSDYGITWQHRYIDDTLALQDVKFIDSMHGVIAAQDGTMLFTSDAGTTWSRSHIPTTSSLDRVAYPSSDTAYVCDGSGVVWQTTDRGTSWTPQQVSNSQYPGLNSIYFFDARTGFVVGNSGVFAKTTDAGEHWIGQDIGAGDTTDLFSIDFYDRDTGIVGGRGYPFVTTDGGATWAMRALLPLGYDEITAIKLTSGHEFFAFSDGDRLFTSSNLGITVAATQILGSGEIYINGVLYDPKHGALAVGGDGEIEQSTDAGMNWNALNLCVSSGNLVNFGDSVFCGVGGYSGNSFYRTTDSGNTWSSYGFSSIPWVGLWFDSPKDGIVLNGNGLGQSLQTTDGGITWSNAGLSDPPGHISGYGIFEYIGDTAYLLAPGDTIFVTTNHGNTWKGSHIPIDSSCPYPGFRIEEPTIKSIFILDGMHAYAVEYYNDSMGTSWNFQYHSRYYQTKDGGLSWNEMVAPATPVNFGSICFRNPSLGFIACDSGVLYRTSDGGSTWQREVLSGDHIMTAVNFLNDTIGFCSVNNQVLHTTDGGLTWQDDSLRIPGGQEGASQFLFPDSNTVVALGGFYRRKLNITSPASVASTPSGNLIQYLYINLYPTPTTNTLNVELDGMYIAPPGTLTCGLYDILGRNVLDLTTNAQRGNNGYTSVFSFYVNILPNGVYTLDYSLGGLSYSHSVVVIH